MGVAAVLWPQQMPPLWPSVQMVIMKRREKKSEKEDAESGSKVRLTKRVMRFNERAKAQNYQINS